MDKDYYRIRQLRVSRRRFIIAVIAETGIALLLIIAIKSVLAVLPVGLALGYTLAALQLTRRIRTAEAIQAREACRPDPLRIAILEKENDELRRQQEGSSGQLCPCQGTLSRHIASPHYADQENS